MAHVPRAAGDVRPWELEGAAFTPSHFASLPDSWRTLPLDEVATRTQQVGVGAEVPESQTLLTELGMAVIEQTRSRIRAAQQEGRTQLDAGSVTLLPDQWHSLPIDQLDDYLRASRMLSPTEVARLQGLLAGVHLVRSDGSQVLNAAFAGIIPPVITAGMA